jgi:hypothetical protein
VKPLEYSKGVWHVEFGFPPSAKVFYECLQDETAQRKVLGHLREYFGEKVDFKMLLMEKKSGFMSKADLVQKEKEQILREKRENILSQPLIKEAEEIFGTKIDRIFTN